MLTIENTSNKVIFYPYCESLLIRRAFFVDFHGTSRHFVFDEQHY